MLRKFYYLIISFGFVFVMAGGTAAAHELEASGSISAVLHVEPNDVVIAGKPSTYDLEFKDTAGKFKLSDCNCQLVVHRNEKTVSKGTFAIANSTTATGSITAPTSDGEYEVAVSGAPKTADAFKAFDLEFPITVKAARSSTTPLIVAIILAALGLLVGFFGLRYVRRRLKT